MSNLPTPDDPKDSEIARLTAALRLAEDQSHFFQVKAEEYAYERDSALASVHDREKKILELTREYKMTGESLRLALMDLHCLKQGTP